MIDHDASIALARERAAHLADEYRRARRPVRPRREAIPRTVAVVVAIVVRRHGGLGPAYRH
jgi:hypothetical protein